MEGGVGRVPHAKAGTHNCSQMLCATTRRGHSIIVRVMEDSMLIDRTLQEIWLQHYIFNLGYKFLGLSCAVIRVYPEFCREESVKRPQTVSSHL